MSFRVTEFEGSRVVHAQSWTPDVARAVARPGVERLSLVGIDSDLSFLGELPQLDMVSLMVQKPKDLSAIGNLVGVRELHLTLGRGRVVPADFSQVPGLLVLGLDWADGMAIGDLPHLRELKISRAPGPGLRFFGELPELEVLWLSNSRKVRTFDGISRFRQLREFQGYNLPGLESLVGISELADLRAVSFEACKRISELDEIGALKALESLELADCGAVASLRPLCGLEHLRTLSAHSDTRIVDGDLSPLLGLRSLRDLRMRERREYTPSVADVRERLTANLNEP